MPKIVFSDFKGLSKTNRNEDGKFSVGDLIDPYRDLGFIKPAIPGTPVSKVAALGGTIKDMARYDSSISYAIDAVKLHQINAGAIVSAGSYPHSLASAMGAGIGTEFYTNKVLTSGILGTRLFYIGETKAGLLDYNNADGFDDDWLNTVPASAAAFSLYGSGAEHPKIVWNNLLFIGDGRYVVKYDGLTGTQGTYTAQWFDVGWNWKVKGFFRTSQYLGIIVRGFYLDDQSEIIVIDGSSATEAVRRINIAEKVISGINLNNELFFTTQDIVGKCWIKQLKELGLDPLFELKFENATTSSTTDTFSAPTRFSEVDIYDNKIAFGCKTGTTSFIFVLGKIDGVYTLSKPFTVTGQTITAVKWLDAGTLYVASYTSTSYYLQKFTTGTAVATMKLPFKDMGQKIRINYIKFYFKTLITNDSMTAGLDIDYNTSVTLKDNADVSTIAYATDGAITSKKFKVGRDCHAFRPTLNWAEGGTSIAKIVVDYDFLPNDN